MTDNYREALAKLLKVQKALESQDISNLPTPQIAALEKSKAGVYAEIQAIQTTEMNNLEDEYKVVTTSFIACKSELQKLSFWLAKRQKMDQEILNILSKGVSLALTLLG